MAYLCILAAPVPWDGIRMDKQNFFANDNAAATLRAGRITNDAAEPTDKKKKDKILTLQCRVVRSVLQNTNYKLKTTDRPHLI